MPYCRDDVKWINELACMHYNAHPIMDDKNKIMFRIGDKVCMYKNSLVGLYVMENGRIKAKLKEGFEQRQPHGDGDLFDDLQDSLSGDDKRGNEDTAHVNNQVPPARVMNQSRHNSSRLNNSIANTSQLNKSQEEEQQEKVRLCNGEIFYIIGVSFK